MELRLGSWLSAAPRAVYGCVALVFIVALLWGGRQPVAVGLFPPPYDLVAHLVAYAVLALLVSLAVGGRWPWLVVVAVGFIGFVDEYQQLSLPGRHPTFSDALMDVLAAILVVGALSIWARRGRLTRFGN